MKLISILLLLAMVLILGLPPAKAGGFCNYGSTNLEKQVQGLLLDQAVDQCKQSLKSEQCKRFLFANPKYGENDIKTCSHAEVARAADLMTEGSRTAVINKYGKKAEALWQSVKNIPNIRFPTNLAKLTLVVGTIIFDTLGKVVDYGQLGFSSISQCFEKNEICLSKLFAITDAEVEKLKIKTAGFGCLKPEVQASLVTMAIIETSEVAGFAPENLLVSRTTRIVAGKVIRNKSKVENGDEDKKDNEDTKQQRNDADVMVARSTARQNFIDEFTEERQKAFFSQLNSAEFVEQANADLAGGKNASRRLYFIRENAYLKTMNDETHDFDFVTSLNLFDQMNFNHEVDLLLARPENADLFKHLGGNGRTHKYRDGKTFQGSFSLEGLTQDQEERLVKLINEACTNNLNTATQKFGPLLRNADDGSHSDLPKNLASAFKCGVGYNHISAGHAARRARSETHIAETELSDFRNYGQVAAPLVNKANKALERAKDLKDQLPASDWKKLWNEEKGLFSLDVFEALRKSGSSHELVGKLKEYSGVTINRTQADRLFLYKTSIDSLSPNFLDEGAEILNFDKANFGGLKSDFPNVGARNFESLAAALKDAKSGTNGAGLNDLPQHLKQAEQRVTDALGRQKSELGKLVNKVFSNVTCMKTSGDDGSTHFGCPVLRSVKQTFVNQASQNSDLKSTRFAFFADNVVAADRMGLANHGEFLEKNIRSFLRNESAFTKEELKNLTMAIDLQGERLWTGKIDMILAGENNLSPEQKKVLDVAFDRALKLLASENAGKSGYNRATRFSTDKVVIPEN